MRDNPLDVIQRMCNQHTIGSSTANDIQARDLRDLFIMIPISILAIRLDIHLTPAPTVLSNQLVH